jgi:hypothetical protein
METTKDYKSIAQKIHLLREKVIHDKKIVETTADEMLFDDVTTVTNSTPISIQSDDYEIEFTRDTDKTYVSVFVDPFEKPAPWEASLRRYKFNRTRKATSIVPLHTKSIPTLTQKTISFEQSIPEEPTRLNALDSVESTSESLDGIESSVPSLDNQTTMDTYFGSSAKISYMHKYKSLVAKQNITVGGKDKFYTKIVSSARTAIVINALKQNDTSDSSTGE